MAQAGHVIQPPRHARKPPHHKFIARARAFNLTAPRNASGTFLEAQRNYERREPRARLVRSALCINPGFGEIQFFAGAFNRLNLT
jgi:hypothetical protein